MLRTVLLAAVKRSPSYVSKAFEINTPIEPYVHSTEPSLPEKQPNPSAHGINLISLSPSANKKQNKLIIQAIKNYTSNNHNNKINIKAVCICALIKSIVDKKKYFFLIKKKTDNSLHCVLAV